MLPESPRHPIAETHRRAAEQAVSDPIYVDTVAKLESMTQECEEAHVIGLDTEFVRERTFYARPGLIQASDGRRIWLVDPVAIPEAPLLGALLKSESTTMVLHSVGEDLEILHAVGGCWPTPLFDTQVAAAMLGAPLQLRYEHLVERVLGVELAGGKARNDWCKRPLAPALLRYAAEDVIWLPELKERLEDELRQADRLEWHREDCDRIVAQARAGSNVAPLSRVKGAGRLDTPAVAFLDALARWREDAAMQADLPRRFVVSDDALIDMAEAAASGDRDRALSGLPQRQRSRHGATISQVLGDVDVPSYDRPGWLDSLTPEQREQVREAQKAVRGVAEELGIEPAVIASKKELTRLIRGEHPEWLDGWRGQVLAGRLESASGSMPFPQDTTPR